MIIYKATNKINKMSYIGQTTTTLKRRISTHKNSAKFYNGYYFHKALRKYGIDNFDWKILKYCKNKNELDRWEKYYITIFNTKVPIGYNLTNGGEGSLGRILTPKQRKKLSEAHIGIKMPPKPQSEIDSIRKRMIGKGNPMYGKFGKLNPLFGKNPFSEKMKDEIFRKTYIFTSPEGKEIIFKGFKKFCKINNFNYSTMQKILYGGIKQGHHRGWRVRHYEAD